LLKSQVLSSEWNTERVREDASGDSVKSRSAAAAGWLGWVATWDLLSAKSSVLSAAVVITECVMLVGGWVASSIATTLPTRFTTEFLSFTTICLRNNFCFLKYLDCLSGGDLAKLSWRSMDPHPQLWPGSTGKGDPCSGTQVVHDVPIYINKRRRKDVSLSDLITKSSDGTIYRIVSNIAILRSYRGISLSR